MGTTIANKIKGTSLQTKISIIFLLVMASFLYQAILKPLIGVSASTTQTYYFTSAIVNVGSADGSTTSSPVVGSKIVMNTTPYLISDNVAESLNLLTEETMLKVYSDPVYAGVKSLTAPAITIGVRGRVGAQNRVDWKAYVYDYNPAGAANNGVLLWTSNGDDFVNPMLGSSTTILPLTFTNPQPKSIANGHRLKVVITCKQYNANANAQLYWGNAAYSFMTVTVSDSQAEAALVTNLADYSHGGLTSIMQNSAVAMLDYDLYTNAASGTATWTGGKLDKIGSNSRLYVDSANTGDVSFSIYRDDGDQTFSPLTDTKIGGPYYFSQATGQSYTLPTPETITTTPQHYFIIFAISKNADPATTVGARIVDNSYFTVPGATVINTSSTSTPLAQISSGGVPISKVYPADWDDGHSFTWGITSITTNSPNITRSTVAPGNMIGLLNYPQHTNVGVAGANYTTTIEKPNFLTLYFAGSGYGTDMKLISGETFTFRLLTPSSGSGGTSGGKVTLTLFYIKPDGTRVNSTVSSTYSTTTSTNATVTVSLAGQTFGSASSPVPKGSRLGIQIGLKPNSARACGIGLGSSVGSQLQVSETAAENNNVDVGEGSNVPNAGVYASSTGKLINSFTLNASKPQTVTAVKITGSAMFNATNVKTVKLYADTGSVLGSYDGTDALLGSSSTFSGNNVTISGLNQSVNTATKRYLIVCDISDTPNTNVIMSAFVSDLTVVNTGQIPTPAMGENSDVKSGTLNILPTTTLSDFIVAEPWSPTFSKIISSNAGATKVDAFGLKTNGGVNDTISEITVILSTTSTPPAGKLISDYVGRVDILTAAGASLGHLTAPTNANSWQVPVTGIAATTTGTDYYVAITPKGNQNITYTVKAMVTGVVHSRSTNQLNVSDSGSAIIIMDEQPPLEQTLTAVTGTYGAEVDKGQINLSWPGTTDSGGSAVSYILVRGLGNAPPPRSCTIDNVNIFPVYGPGTNLSVVNKGLDEGASYGYRLCGVDSVGNTSFGSTASTTASIKTRCGELPGIDINPMASYIKAATTTAFNVTVTNMNTGVCPDTTFTLAIVGTDIDDNNYTTSTFSANGFTIATNKGTANTNLNITAKPGAVQGAIKTFHVKVTKSTDSLFTQCPDPVYVTVSKHGTMMHSSMNLGTAKHGSWGTDYNCKTCHSPNSTNIKKLKNVIGTPTGSRQVVFSITSTARNANVTGVFGNDNRIGTASTNVCEVCHHNVRYHQYSTAKISWKDHNNNADCMACHPHSKGFKANSLAGSCTDCHGNPPTTEAMLVLPTTNVLYAYGSNVGSHEKHDLRQVKCAACHSNANHLLTAVPDSKLNMGFSIKGSNFTGFVGNISSGTINTLPASGKYSWNAAAHTTLNPQPGTIMNCNVYCHGWPGNGGYNSQPDWSGISQVGCGSCHAANGNDPPTSGSHHKHASTEPGFGNGIACKTCHGFHDYSTSSAHINGNVEWDLSDISETIGTYREAQKGSTGKKAPTAPGSYGSCANLYCHSNVVNSVSNNGLGAPNSFANPTWGGTTTCGSCHVEPNNTGGHTQHAVSGETRFDCRICHASGGDANPLNHGNGQINFMFSGLGENTHYSYSSTKIPGSGTYGTCYNSNCHGNRRAKSGVTSLAWGPSTGRPLCDKCHSTSAAGGVFYGTEGPNGPTAKTDPHVGAHFQHITSMPYKYSAKIDCSSCHLKPAGPYSLGHMDTPLPAEITFGALASSGLQGSFTSAAHTPTYVFGNRQCNNLWCHGAGMASNEGTGYYASAVDDGGILGTPAPAIWNSPFLNGSTTDCTKCHANPPAAPMSGYQHWNENNNRAYISTECVLCHKHVNGAGNGFTNPVLHVNGKVDSCYDCHGRPPTNEASLTVPEIGALNSGMVGAHQNHTRNPNIGWNCDICHYNYSPAMPSYKLEIGFRAFGGKVTSGTFYGYSTLTGDYSPQIVYFSTWTSTKVRRTNDETKVNTCQNMYCHGGGTMTLQPIGGGSNITPNWENGSSQAVCGSCHGTTGSTYNVRGSHNKHINMLALDCSYCHGLKLDNYHVNGKVEWEFYSTVKRLNQTAGYSKPGYRPVGFSAISSSTNTSNNGNTGKLAPSAGYGTCQVYCHSDVFTKTYKNQTWGGAPMTCGSCHKNMVIEPKITSTGSHYAHAYNYRISCDICHGHVGSGSFHVNGSIDIIFNKGVAGKDALYVKSAGVGQCNTSCHLNTTVLGGNVTGPKWGGGTTELTPYPATCVGCHSGAVGNRIDVAPQLVSQSHHVQKKGQDLSPLDCAICHREATTTGAKDATYHKGDSTGAVNLAVWGTKAGYPVTAGTLDRTAVVSFISYTANGKRSSIAKLNNHCLGCHSSPNASFKPFNTYSTIRYSWEKSAGLTAKTSVQSRYSSTKTVRWSIYSTSSKGTAIANFGTNKKHKTVKALSAHGNASKNQMDNWDVATNGEDGDMADYSYAGTGKNRNVFCYDCHNSHGSAASGITSSYSSATGRYKGGILKTTRAGKGGYANDYTPAARTVSYLNYGKTQATPATFNPGASICNDCHNDMNPSGATLTKPWDVQKTYSSSGNRYGSIGGYWSTPYFDNYTTPSALRTLYKRGGSIGSSNDYRKPMGGHFGSSINGTSAAHTGEINGLCTPCHDPHGVTNSLPGGTVNRQYAVPLLKGTWLTSPYKEDKADVVVARGGGSKVVSFYGGAVPGYHIDQNTLLNQPQAINGGPVAAPLVSSKGDNRGMAFRNLSNSAKKIDGLNAGAKKTTAEFAGLCTGCHTQTALTGSASAPAAAAAWMSKERVHQTVNGWAATGSGTGNLNNKIHAFTCSKCHAPHVSRLPRLMVTNCIDPNHAGMKVSGGTPVSTPPTAQTTYYDIGNVQVVVSTAQGAGRFPSGGRMYNKGNGNIQNQGPWWFQTWPTTTSGMTGVINNPASAYTTSSTDDAPFATNCHNSPTAGGGAYTWDPTLQKWNTKTNW